MADTMKEFQPLDIGVGLPLHEKRDAADVQAAIDEALANRGVLFHAGRRGGGGIPAVGIPGGGAERGGDIASIEGKRKLAEQIYGASAAEFGESIRDTFDPNEIRETTWTEIADLETNITTPLPGVTVSEMFVRGLREKVKQLNMAIRNPDKARKKGLGLYGLVDYEVPVVTKMPDSDNFQLTWNQKTQKAFLEAAGMAEDTTDTTAEETPEQKNERAIQKAQRAIEALQSLKPYRMEAMEWEEHVVIADGAVVISQEARNHLERKYPALRSFFRETVTIPAIVETQEMEDIKKEIEGIIKSFETRVKFAFLFYKYKTASQTIDGLQNMLSDFAEVGPMDWKESFTLGPSKEGGEPLGHQRGRAVRLFVLLAQLGQWMNTDCSANYGDPERLVISAEQITYWKNEGRGGRWLEKFRELWEKQPEFYRKLFDVGVLDKVEFKSVKEEKEHASLTDESRRKINTGELKLSYAEKNMLQLIEMAGKRFFNRPSNLVSTRRSVMDWVQEIITHPSEVPDFERMTEEELMAYEEKRRVNSIDAKIAVLLAHRDFRVMGYDSYFDNNADRGAYGAALSTPMADNLMNFWFTSLYDALFIEDTEDPERGGAAGSRDRKRIPDYLLQNPLKVRLKDKNGKWFKKEVKLENLLASYPHMVVVNTKDPSERRFDADGARTLHELLLHEGLEFWELPWERAEGSMWVAMWEPFYYLMREGGAQDFMVRTPRDGITLDGMRALNAADYKAITHAIFTVFYDGSIVEFKKHEQEWVELAKANGGMSNLLYRIQIAYRRWILGGRITHDYQNNPLEAYRKYGLWPPRNTAADIVNKDSLQQALGVILKGAHIIDGPKDMRNAVVNEFADEKKWLEEKGII